MSSRPPSDFRAKVFAAVSATPSPTRREARRRRVLAVAAGGLLTLIILFAARHFATETRPTRHVLFAALGQVAVAAATTMGAFGGLSATRSTRRLWITIAAPPVMTMALALAGNALWPLSVRSPASASSNWLCLALTFAMSTGPAVAFAVGWRRTSLRRARLQAAAMGAVAATWAASGITLCCPYTSIPHVIDHALPVWILALAGAWLGSRWIALPEMHPEPPPGTR